MNKLLDILSAFQSTFETFSSTYFAAEAPEGYPATYYSTTLPQKPPLRPSLKKSTDVCVVGGGLAGLSVALGLLERGKKVVVLEQNRVASEASGRNAGFAIAGYAVEAEDLVAKVGTESARKMYSYSVEAMQILRKRISTYKIDCDLEDEGLVTACVFNEDEEEVKQELEELNKTIGSRWEYPFDLRQYWPREKMRQLYNTDLYRFGIYDPTAFSLNPLKLSLGLAVAAEKAGAEIFEKTRAVELLKIQNTDEERKRTGRSHKWQVTTEGGGTVTANDVVLAANVQLPSSLLGELARAIVPGYTYIMVTEPLGEQLKQAIKAPHAVCDNRFALSYYRPLPGNRLLWGGYFQTYPVSPEKLQDVLLRDLHKTYPQLQNVKPEIMWGGRIGYGWDMMPLIGQKEPGLWYATGFGGHGLIPTTVAGELISSAIANGDTRYKLFQDHFPIKYAGWPFARIGAQIYYWQLQLRDEWRLWRQKMGW